MFQIIRGDVDIDKIKALKVMSTTWKLYLEEAPEAFEVIGNDEQGKPTIFSVFSIWCYIERHASGRSLALYFHFKK